MLFFQISYSAQWTSNQRLMDELTACRPIDFSSLQQRSREQRGNAWARTRAHAVSGPVCQAGQEHHLAVNDALDLPGKGVQLPGKGVHVGRLFFQQLIQLTQDRLRSHQCSVSESCERLILTSAHLPVYSWTCLSTVGPVGSV